MILKDILAVAFGTKQLDTETGIYNAQGDNIDRKHLKGQVI